MKKRILAVVLGAVMVMSLAGCGSGTSGEDKKASSDGEKTYTIGISQFAEASIIERQNIIQVFLDNFFERSDLTESLKGVYDIERLASRVSFGKANPKDLIQLGHTLAQVPIIKAILESFNDDTLSGLLQELDALPELESLIRSAIDPDAPATITEIALKH